MQLLRREKKLELPRREGRRRITEKGGRGPGGCKWGRLASRAEGEQRKKSGRLMGLKTSAQKKMTLKDSAKDTAVVKKKSSTRKYGNGIYPGGEGKSQMAGVNGRGRIFHSRPGGWRSNKAFL